MDNTNTCLICLQTVFENQGIDLECGCKPVKPCMHHKCYKVWEQTQIDNGEKSSCPHCRQVSKIIDYKID